MNTKSLIIAIVTGFVFIFASDFLLHGVLLDADYKATAQLWRPEPEMQSRFHWMLVAQLLCAAAFVVIWAKSNWGDGSIGSACIFGLWMGLFGGIMCIALYVVTPMPAALAAKWFIAGVVQAVLLGAITAAIYKRGRGPA